MIPFIISAIFGIIDAYFSGRGQLALVYVEELLTILGMGSYLFYLVVIPIREASVVPLMRGSVTMRHGQYSAPLAPPEP
jgi:hypothetical protein